MKKLVSLVCGLLLSLTLAYGQDTCHITITGSFDSECQYDFKDLPVYEIQDILIACQNSTVTYTAHADVGTATVASYTWEVYGDVTHTSTGNQVTVSWDNGSWGLLVVTVATTAGDTCTESSYVGLIETPTVAASTVPAYTIDGNGDKVIRVCRHSRVEFLDQSDAHGSDIAGYLWESKQGGTSTTPHYVIEDVTMDDQVVHRVYNNCGCYDEETYYIEYLEGEPLELDCYGTVCEGAVVTYKTLQPGCDDYVWHVEGGTLVDGQYSDRPTVQWDRPQGGYGVLSLDGVRCGVEVCPAMMSVRVPVIEDSLGIEGPQSVCLGESALYRLPLFGSTEYTWSITPAASEQGLYAHGNEMRYTFNTAGTYHITVSYRCDFLDCGPYHTRELEVNVRPRLEIEGHDRLCAGNACNLATEPAVPATWQAYDLGTGQPVGTAVNGMFYTETFTQPGRYLVTAEHPAYCGPATFVLDVLSPPPAPTVAEMDPGNRHTACPYGGIGLSGTPSQPNYLLVWAPACSTATPQLYTGDSVNIGYGATVCDVAVYHYDVLLQCQSAAAYVHTVTALAPEPTTLPTSITVCPNSLVSLTGMVPDQRADGMLYEWKIQPTMQHCASVTGSHQAPDVDLLINKLSATTAYTFYVELTRSYCNGASSTHRIDITVNPNLVSSCTVSGANPVCVGTSNTYSCTGCPDASFTFTEPGLHYATFYCNPYDYCDNRSYYTPASMAVTVWPKPEVAIEYDDGFLGTLTANATGTGPFTYDWYYRSLALGSQWVYAGNTASIAEMGMGYYRCTVTDGHGCTNEVTYHHNPPLIPCSTMNLTAGSYDYCYHSIQVTSPYSTRNVTWTVEGGDYGIVTSGTNNSVATVTVMDNGPYTVCAKTRAPIPGTMAEGCYEGCYTFSPEFVGDFTFDTRCDTIVISNYSIYQNGNNHVYMDVKDGSNNIVGSFNFPVSQAVYKYVTPSNGTYYFYLTQYGNITVPQPCPIGSATVNLPSNRSVSISTDNDNDPTATCDNTPIRLTATLNYTGASILHSTWVFGDGSSYTTEGGSVFHTFEAQTGPYYVNVTVTDSRGCGLTSNPPLGINSRIDNISGGTLFQSSPLQCPHIFPPTQQIEFLPNSSLPVPNHYNWTSPLTGTNYYNYVSEPELYSISVVNDNFCKKEGAIIASFKPCPTARIHAERYSCCEGEPLPLYGSLAPNTNISYMWDITGTGYHETFNTPDIVFTPPTAGTYAVTLTVTDNAPASGCSSTTQTTVTAVAKPAAPSLYFPGDSCIGGAPVTVAATAASYSGELHWSNGGTGATAQYYTPGNATAYYFDPAIGCASQTGAVLIHRQPDFDALLTGCYEKCQSFLAGYQLPVYCLTPNRIGWQWYMGAGILASATSAYMPLSLPLVRPDTYRLEVDYQNGGCHAVSPNLTIRDKTVCDCDSIRVSIKDVALQLHHCEVHYNITLDVCNDNTNEDFCIDDVLVLSDAHNVTIDNVTYTGSTVHANGCETVYLDLTVAGLIPTDVLLRIVDRGCMGCTKDFFVELTCDADCEKEMHDGYLEPDMELSNEAAVYCDFGADLPSGCELLGVWTEPAMVAEHVWDGTTGSLNGLCMFDRAALTRMATEEGVVCLHVLLCCDDDLCDYSYCVDASDILEALNRRDSTHRESSLYRPHARPAEARDLRLVPNPTTGEVAIEMSNPLSGVTITGTPDEVVEVTVMDMHGRKMASFKETDQFNISTFAAGSYIVRVKTRSDDGEKVTYLKLVKK